MSFFGALPEVAAELGRLQVVLRRAVTQARGTPLDTAALVTPVTETVSDAPAPSYGFHSPAPPSAPRLPPPPGEKQKPVTDTLVLLRRIAGSFHECGDLVMKIVGEIEKRARL